MNSTNDPWQMSATLLKQVLLMMLFGAIGHSFYFEAKEPNF